MTSTNGATPSAGGFPRVGWIVAALVAFISWNIGQLTGMWGSEMSGVTSPIPDGITDHVNHLRRAMQSGKPAAFAGAVVGYIAVAGAPAEHSWMRVHVVGVIVGTIAGAIGGFLYGYYQ